MNAPLFELVREGIVNALVHRDYSITGGKCQLVVTPDKIAVWSPGLPIEPITLEQMQSFTAPMLSRNPPLHHVFARMALAEERGLGLRSLKDRAQQLGLPLPRYVWNNPYLVLTFYPNREAAAAGLPVNVQASLAESELRGWQWMAVTGRASARQYAEALSVEDRTARRHLNHFLDLGLVRRVGSGPSTEYEIV